MHVYVIEGWHNTLDYEIKTILLRFEKNTEQKIKILKSLVFFQSAATKKLRHKYYQFQI